MPMKVYFGVRRQTRLLQGENTEMQDFTILSKPALVHKQTSLRNVKIVIYTVKSNPRLDHIQTEFQSKTKQFGLMTSIQLLTSALFERKKGQMWLLMWH